LPPTTWLTAICDALSKVGKMKQNKRLKIPEIDREYPRILIQYYPQKKVTDKNGN